MKNIRLRFLFYLIIISGLTPFIFSNCEDFSSTGPYIIDTNSRGETLDIIWSVKHDSIDATSSILNCIYGDNLLLCYDRYLHLLNKKTGATIWKVISTHSNRNASAGANVDDFIPVGTNDFIYIAIRYVERRSLIDGSLIWRYEPPNNDVASSRQVNKDSQSDKYLYLTTVDSHQLYCLDKETGVLLWSKPLMPDDGSVYFSSSRLSPAMYYNGRVYVGSREYPPSKGLIRNGSVYCLDALTGNLIWKSIMPLPDNSIQNYEKWNLLNNNEIETLISPVKDGFIVGVGYILIKLDTLGKILWKKAISIDGNLSSYDAVNPLIDNNVLFRTNNGGSKAFIYAFDLNSENIKWISWMNPFNSMQTEGAYTPMQIDLNRVYKMTDAQWLLGFNKFSGSLEWATNLDFVLPKGRGSEFCLSPAFVENGNTVYMVLEDHIVCAKRRGK